MKILEYLKGHWQLAAIVTVVFVLWSFPVIIPLKILIVFLHEASHALAALITGGSVDEISLNLAQGGHVISRGGSLFWIISAGYLGSLIFGLGFFVLALRTTWDRLIVGTLGVLMLALTIIYMRELFPIVFCLLTSAFLIALGWFADARFSDLVLRVIGLTSMIYVPYDIFSDTLWRSSLMSDARIMSENIGGPTIFWGALWLVISVIFVGLVLRFTLRQPSNISFQGMRLRPGPR